MSRNSLRLPCPSGYRQRVESLIADRLQLDSAQSITKLRQLFLRHDDLVALPITRDGVPVGRVLARDLLAQTPLDATVASVMREGCQTVPRTRTVDEMLRDLADGALAVDSTGLLVVDERGRYLGRIEAATLIRVLASGEGPEGKDDRLRTLTGGLPGQLALLQRARELLEARSLFVVASLDIRGFNAFNDRYGYQRGDGVIRFVSDLLREHFDPALDFAAYLGGDNFVVLLRSIDWFERCEALLQACEAQAPGFYDAEDRRRGGIEQYDHLGERRFTPIFTLSIGVTQVEPGRFRDQHSLLKSARDLKVRAANGGGGAIFVEGLSGQAMAGVFGMVRH